MDKEVLDQLLGAIDSRLAPLTSRLDAVQKANGDLAARLEKIGKQEPAGGGGGGGEPAGSDPSEVELRLKAQIDQIKADRAEERSAAEGAAPASNPGRWMV